MTTKNKRDFYREDYKKIRKQFEFKGLVCDKCYFKGIENYNDESWKRILKKVTPQ